MMDLINRYKGLPLSQQLLIIGVVLQTALTYFYLDTVTQIFSKFWVYNGLAFLMNFTSLLPLGPFVLPVVSIGGLGFFVGTVVENKKDIMKWFKKYPIWVLHGVIGAVVIIVLMVVMAILNVISPTWMTEIQSVINIYNKILDVGLKPVSHITNLLAKVGIVPPSEVTMIAVGLMAGFIIGSLISYIKTNLWDNFDKVKVNPRKYFGFTDIRSIKFQETAVMVIMSLFVIGTAGFPTPFVVEWPYGYGDAWVKVQTPTGVNVVGAYCSINEAESWGLPKYVAYSDSNGVCKFTSIPAELHTLTLRCPNGAPSYSGVLQIIPGQTVNPTFQLACAGEGCTVTNTCQTSQCHTGDIWCFNNCGQKTNLVQDCGAKSCIQDINGARCEGVATTTSTLPQCNVPCNTYKCYEGDYWCFDNCNKPSYPYTYCLAGEECVDGLGCKIVPTTTQPPYVTTTTQPPYATTTTLQQCPPIPSTRWCPNQEGVKICPQEIDANGCPIWRCDQCSDVQCGFGYTEDPSTGKCTYDIVIIGGIVAFLFLALMLFQGRGKGTVIGNTQQAVGIK